MSQVSQRKKVVSSVIFFAIIACALYAWFSFRGLPFQVTDVLLLASGFASIWWMGVWTKSKNVEKESLIVPYFPIFVIPSLAMLAGQVHWISAIEVLNIVVLFFLSFMGTIAVFAVFGLFVEHKHITSAKIVRRK